MSLLIGSPSIPPTLSRITANVADRPAAGVFVHVLRLALANLFDPLRHVFFADLRLGIRHFDAAVLLDLEFGRDFKLGLEAQRLAIVKMDIRNVRRADDIPVLLVRFFAKRLRQNMFENVLPDGIFETGLDDADGRFAGTKAGQMRFLLHVCDDVLRFVIHFVHRDDDFNFVLAAFDEGHVRVFR